MPNPKFSVNEIRIVGCLMEKAVTTPEQYPLTLNALALACNQKSSRDPVLSLDQDTVRRTARVLEDKGIVTREENFRTGVTKYRQRLCNTPVQRSAVHAGRVRRGLRAAVARVADTRRAAYANGAHARLRRQRGCFGHACGSARSRPRRRRCGRPPATGAGRRDHEYMHLFAGEIDSVLAEERTPAPATPRSSRLDDLEARVQTLEAELAALKRELSP